MGILVHKVNSRSSSAKARHWSSIILTTGTSALSRYTWKRDRNMTFPAIFPENKLDMDYMYPIMPHFNHRCLPSVCPALLKFRWHHVTKLTSQTDVKQSFRSNITQLQFVHALDRFDSVVFMSKGASFFSKEQLVFVLSSWQDEHWESTALPLLSQNSLSSPAHVAVTRTEQT